MCRVLVVDDDREHAESIADIVLMQGHTVDLAFSGEEAMSRSQADPFDFALIDIKLPGIDGVETLQQLVKAKAVVRAALMTGYSAPEKVTAALAAGATEVLSKPFPIEQLLATLEKNMR